MNQQLVEWLEEIESKFETEDDKNRVNKLRSKDIRRGKAPRPMEVSHESNGTQTK